MNTRNQTIWIVNCLLMYAIIMILVCICGTSFLGATVQVLAGYVFTIGLAFTKRDNIPVTRLTTLFGMAAVGALLIAAEWMIRFSGRYTGGLAIFAGGFLLFWLPYLVSLVIRMLRKKASEGEKIILGLAFFLCLIAGGTWLDRNRNTDSISMNVDMRDFPAYRATFEDG